MLRRLSEVPNCRGGVNVGISHIRFGCDGVTCMPSLGHRRRLPRSMCLRSAARRFRRRQRGSVAIESALGITVLVISLAFVMQIVSAAYASDQMSRAAARSIALNPPATQTVAETTACNAIIRELQLGKHQVLWGQTTRPSSV